jgi:hypothetical protein
MVVDRFRLKLWIATYWQCGWLLVLSQAHNLSEFEARRRVGNTRLSACLIAYPSTTAIPHSIYPYSSVLALYSRVFSYHLSSYTVSSRTPSLWNRASLRITILGSPIMTLPLFVIPIYPHFPYITFQTKEIRKWLTSPGPASLKPYLLRLLNRKEYPPDCQ